MGFLFFFKKFFIFFEIGMHNPVFRFLEYPPPPLYFGLVRTKWGLF